MWRPGFPVPELNWDCASSERVGADAPSGGVPVGAANVDKHLLSRAIEGVRKVYQRHKVHLPTINEAELAIDIHDRVVAVATADDERRGALLMALDQLDRKLASTITDETSDKRSVCG